MTEPTTASPAAPTTPATRPGRAFYGFAIFTSVVGGGFGLLGVIFASGAPQEASSAAFGLLCSVVPYVIARSVDERSR